MMMSPTAAKVNGWVIFIASSLDGSCRTGCSTASPCAAPCPRSNAWDATKPAMISAMNGNMVILGRGSVFIGNSSRCRDRFFYDTITHSASWRIGEHRWYFLCMANCYFAGIFGDFATLIRCVMFCRADARLPIALEWNPVTHVDNSVL